MYVGLLNEDHVFEDFLKSNVFAGEERVSRGHFMAICGNWHDKNAFWSVVSQIAAEMFNMHEVFNVHSTVRLTAIEKLCEYIAYCASLLVA